MQYINHYTVTTQHNRQSYKNEIDSEVLAQVSDWLKQLTSGTQRIQMFPDQPFYIELDYMDHYSMSCVVTLNHTEALNIVVCLDPEHAQPTWEKFISLEKHKVAAPYVVAALTFPGNLKFMLDVMQSGLLHWVGDFERCLAWAFAEFKS